LPHDQVDGTHHNDQGMVRRMKEYRARNPEAAEETVKEFFKQNIGVQNVLEVEAMLPEEEQLNKMREIIESKGKPCCINMITPEDIQFLESIKEPEPKAPAEPKPEGEEGEEGEAPSEQQAEEPEVDELTRLIMEEEKAELVRKAQEEEARKKKAAEDEVKRIKEAKEAAKLEKLRE